MSFFAVSISGSFSSTQTGDDNLRSQKISGRSPLRTSSYSGGPGNVLRTIVPVNRTTVGSYWRHPLAAGCFGHAEPHTRRRTTVAIRREDTDQSVPAGLPLVPTSSKAATHLRTRKRVAESVIEKKSVRTRRRGRDARPRLAGVLVQRAGEGIERADWSSCNSAADGLRFLLSQLAGVQTAEHSFFLCHRQNSSLSFRADCNGPALTPRDFSTTFLERCWTEWSARGRRTALTVHGAGSGIESTLVDSADPTLTYSVSAWVNSRAPMRLSTLELIRHNCSLTCRRNGLRRAAFCRRPAQYSTEGP
jgi:hypothetical protein